MCEVGMRVFSVLERHEAKSLLYTSDVLGMCIMPSHCYFFSYYSKYAQSLLIM